MTSIGYSWTSSSSSDSTDREGKKVRQRGRFAGIRRAALLSPHPSLYLALDLTLYLTLYLYSGLRLHALIPPLIQLR